MCWFLSKGANRSSRTKTSRRTVENQRTQPTYDAESSNRIRPTLSGGECSHHHPIPTPVNNRILSPFLKKANQYWSTPAFSRPCGQRLQNRFIEDHVTSRLYPGCHLRQKPVMTILPIYASIFSRPDYTIGLMNRIISTFIQNSVT